MPRNKDLKRLVRARMNKTGEAYTTARAHLTRKRARKTAAPAPSPTPRLTSTPRSGKIAYEELAGMRDTAIREQTGRGWSEWVDLLDRHGAVDMTHTEIARLVRNSYKVGSWWSQAVTVGYERIKGLRVKGQRRDGSYEAGKSRTYNVPVTTLFEAWADPSIRKRWLDGANVTERTARAPKSMRLGWSDGTIITVGFEAKGKGKSTVALAHTKLPDRATSDRMKKYWSDRLEALREVLAPSARLAAES